jgi:hypothetical protein
MSIGQAIFQVRDRLRSEPHAAVSLTLYALATTMNYEQAGCLFRLNKLRDLETAERQLAYALIEQMVAGDNQTPEWQAVVAEMDDIIRAG